MIDLAVQQLHADRHAGVFRDPLDAIEAGDAVRDRRVVAHPPAVAEEGDDVGDLQRRGARYRFLEVADDRIVVAEDVETVPNRAATGIAHRADQAVLTGDRPVRLLEQVDRREPHAGARAAELGERDLLIRPARHRLLEASVFDDPISRYG